MAADHENGVTISLREIYDTIQEVKNEVKGIAPRMQQIEKDAAHGVEALELAKEAHRLAAKHEDSVKWLWRAVATAVITGLVGAIISGMVLTIQWGIKSQVNDPPQTQTDK